MKDNKPNESSPKLLQITSSLVKKDFEMPMNSSFISEEDLVQALADRVFQLIEKNLEQLFSILYRLDVNERKVHEALQGNNEIPANIEIARLIVARQKEKAKTRMEYDSKEVDDEDATPW